MRLHLQLAQADRPVCGPGGGPTSSAPGGRPGSEAAPRDLFEWPGELPGAELVAVDTSLDPLQLVDEARL